MSDQRGSAQQPTEPPGAGPDEYLYDCVDRSFLLPHFKKHYVAQFYRAVPARLTANMITIASAVFMWAMVPLCLLGVARHQALFGGLCALLIHNYLVGDHLDGMHAKATNTSSPLGEFLDHFLDVFNGSLMLWAGVCLLNVQSTAVLPLLLFVYFLCFAATMMEQQETGRLQMGRYGNLESFVTMILFFLSWTIPAVQLWWHTPLIWGVEPRWLFVGVAIFGFLFTTTEILRRMGRAPRHFIYFVLGSLALALLVPHLTRSGAGAYFLLALFAGDYIGRVLGCHFLAARRPMPDMPTTAAALTLLPLYRLGLIPAQAGGIILALLMVVLAARLVTGPGRVIYNLRSHWRWVNG